MSEKITLTLSLRISAKKPVQLVGLEMRIRGTPVTLITTTIFGLSLAWPPSKNAKRRVISTPCSGGRALAAGALNTVPRMPSPYSQNRAASSGRLQLRPLFLNPAIAVTQENPKGQKCCRSSAPQTSERFSMPMEITSMKLKLQFPMGRMVTVVPRTYG